MARIRSIKPEFFDDPDVGQLSAEAALFFIGILTQADKAGRLCDEPRRLKVRIRPYSDCDPEAVLTELSGAGFIIRYTGSDGRALIQVRSFLKHQRPHPKEAESELEAPTLEDCSVKTQSREKVVLSREKDMASKVVSGGRKESLEVGREGEGSLAAIAAEPSPAGLMAAWNDITQKPIPRCRELTKGRRRNAQVRLAERPLHEWREVIARIQASSFCRGENERAWVASFDWLLQPDVAVKVLEGKYDDRKGPRVVDIPPRAEIGSWRDECQRVHGGQCGNQHFHAAKMAVAS